jgi:hypothetical protein
MDHEQAELLGRLSDALGPVPVSVMDDARALFRENASRRGEDENSEDVRQDRKGEVRESRSVFPDRSRTLAGG